VVVNAPEKKNRRTPGTTQQTAPLEAAALLLISKVQTFPLVYLSRVAFSHPPRPAHLDFKKRATKMVRKGKFEVTVVRPSDGTPFHEVLDPASGAVYVVAEPGANYEIEVSRRDASPNKTYRFIPKVRAMGAASM
jgi:hypothetical protein